MTGTDAIAGQGAARRKLLDVLKRLGPAPADALARALGVTAMAVRQHLYALKAQGLVSYRTEIPDAGRGRGRPVKLWTAEEKADALFPDAHAALAADLIANMRAAFGEKGLDRILALRTAGQERVYGARLAGARTLKARLDALARIRSDEGYMAEVRREDGGFLFVENHCPVCAAARACTGLCREELHLFQRVVGDDVEIARTDHIVAGARRCAYKVVPRNEKSLSAARK